MSTVNSSLLTTYAYLPGTDLISGLAYDTIGHQWTRTYEPSRNLIASVQTHHNSTLLASYDYANDAIGRRTSISRSGTPYDAPVQDHYGYNERSEVTSARRYLSSQPLALSPQPSLEVPGFAYDYAYDAIGNRITATEYDHQNLPLVSNYTSNELNQYEARTVPGYAAVRGVSDPGTFVTVNDNPAAQTSSSGGALSHFYGGDYVDNTQGPVLHPLTITAALPANDPQQLLTVNSSLSTDPDLTTTETGSLFVAQTPELFTYDDDGNLLSDGHFSYTWDAENRLIRAQTLPSAILLNTTPSRVDYTYDHQYRRIKKDVSSLDNHSWTLSETRHFLYDDWNLIRETTAIANVNSSLLPINSVYFSWGLDLSGSLQGAGGVGGLQLVTRDNTPYFPISDANGNINGYADISGTLVAKYEYSPFGETLYQVDNMANEFVFRFSSKYLEKELMLSYYGYRFYSPSWGEWINRDPIDEGGGINLYNFNANNPVILFDYLGLTFVLNEKPVTIEYLNQEFSVPGTLIGGVTLGSLAFGIEDDIILNFIKQGSKCYCARVIKGKTIDVEVDSWIPMKNTYMTKRGLNDMIRHERLRQEVYRIGYNHYFVDTQENGKHVTRCNDFCSEKEGEAKAKLQGYLSRLREKAKVEFKAFNMVEQIFNIEQENASTNLKYNKKGLFDGHKWRAKITPPPEFIPPECPNEQ